MVGAECGIILSDLTKSELNENMVKSGEDLGPLFRTLVGDSPLKKGIVLPLRISTMTFPLAVIQLSTTREYQIQL